MCLYIEQHLKETIVGYNSSVVGDQHWLVLPITIMYMLGTNDQHESKLRSQM